jgi:8-oxo-dGTP diphosphatase
MQDSIIANDLFEREDKHYLTVWMEGQYLSPNAIVNTPGEISAVNGIDFSNTPPDGTSPLVSDGTIDQRR